MAKLGDAFVTIRARLDTLKAGLAKAFTMTSSAMKAISSMVSLSMTGITRILRGAFDFVYTWGRRAFLAVSAAATAATWAFTKFQHSMAMVSTMLAEKTMPLLKGFGQEIRLLSVRVGQSTATLARSLYDILSASVAPQKAIGVLKDAAKMAIAGFTQTETAASALLTVMNSYGMAAEKAGEIAGKLFAAVKRGRFTFEQLASSIGKAAATGALVGVKFEELLAIISTTTRAGVSIDETMTAVVGTLNAFLKPTTEGTKVAKEFGLELSSNTLRSIGLLEAIKKLNKASAEQLTAIVPNRRAFKALAAALQDMTGYTYDLGFITKATATTMEEAFTKATANLDFRFKRLVQALKEMFVRIGETLVPTINKALDAMAYTLSKLYGLWTRNEAVIQSWLDTAVAGLTKVWKFLHAIYTVAQETGWAKALGAAATVLWEKLQPVFKWMGATIKKVWGQAIEFISPYMVRLGELIAEGFKGAMIDPVKNWASQKWRDLTTFKVQRTNPIEDIRRAPPVQWPTVSFGGNNEPVRILQRINDNLEAMRREQKDVVY